MHNLLRIQIIVSIKYCHIKYIIFLRTRDAVQFTEHGQIKLPWNLWMPLTLNGQVNINLTFLFTKYDVSTLYSSKVMTKVIVEERQRNRQNNI